MTMYLLLRDNKQSGPYSFDELKAKGLKAYDLVWVEGKSAAWRYPSEVDELRSFAPVVEEQPFDRFYKKPAAMTTASAPIAAQTASTSSQPSINENIFAAASTGTGAYAGEPAGHAGKRTIYVTLPAGKSVPVNKEQGGREPVRAVVTLPERQTAYNNQAFSPTAKAAPLEKEVTIPEKTIGAYKGYSLPGEALLSEREISSLPVSPVSLHEEKLSQYTADPKDNVEFSPRARRRRSSAWQPVLVTVCILALLAAGVFIGLSINKDGMGLSKKLAVREDRQDIQTVPPPGSQPDLPKQTFPDPTPSNQQTLPAAADSVKNERDPIQTAAQTPERSASAPLKDAKAKTAPIAPAPRAQMPAVLPAAKDSAVAINAAVHREASHRTDLSSEKTDKDLIRSNLSNLVSLGASKFNVGTFGGISDLQLTVSNRSVYPLDLVVVEVQYIQANKKVFKTENLYFRGIGPGAALMQEAPKSTRGITVQYKITLVNSKELGLSYSTL